MSPVEEERSATGVATGLAPWITGIFVVLVFGIALVDLASYRFFPVEVDPTRGQIGRRQSGQGFWGGEPLRWVESQLESRSFAASELRPRWAELAYVSLRHTGGRVLAGRDGWFYLQRTLEPLPKRDEAIESFVRWLDAIDLALATKDIEFIAAVAPSKATVYPEFLPLGTPDVERLYEPFVTGLREAGIDVVDLLTPLLEAKSGGEILYYKTDTHWNLVGSYLAAGVIAERVERTHPELQPPIEPSVEMVDTPMNDGDLLRMAGFTPGGWLERSLHYSYDRPYVTFDMPGGLLQCYLAGDSYAASCYLALNLSAHLETRVGDVSRNGLGLAHGLGEAFPGLVHDDRNDVQVFVLAFVERQLRETPRLNFSEVARGMGVFYGARYRPLVDLTDRAGPGKFAAIELPDFVLPANGTTAVRFETNHGLDRRVGVKSWVSHPNFMFLPQIPVTAGERVTHFPLVHDEPVTGLTYLFEGGGFAPAESTRVSLVTAYAPVEKLDLGRTSGPHPGGEGRIPVALPRDVPANGRFALGFRLQRGAGDPGRAALFSTDGRPVSDSVPLAAHPAGAHTNFILPVRAADGAPVSSLELRFDAPAVEMAFTEWTLLGL